MKWCIELEEIIRDFKLKTGKHKASMALALLKGSSARDKFQQIPLTLDSTENTQKPEEHRKTRNENFEMTLLEVGKSYFPIMYAHGIEACGIWLLSICLS